MREPAVVRMLADGRRLHLHDGPIDLIVEAEGERAEVAAAYEAAALRFAGLLDELCGELVLLRAQVTRDSAEPRGRVARRMFAAVQPYAEETFITPMAAVAGAVAEEILEAMTTSAELRRAYANNGGDIALHLAQGQSYRIGMVERPDRPSLFGALCIAAHENVRGIATSGWRGRSFSLGVADAVTVLAESAAAADAAATIVANAVNLPGHPGVVRVAARDIAPDSDLGDLRVTRGVPALSGREIREALDAGEAVAERLRRTGLIHSAAMCLQGNTRVVTGRTDAMVEISARSMAHA